MCGNGEVHRSDERKERRFPDLAVEHCHLCAAGDSAAAVRYPDHPGSHGHPAEEQSPRRGRGLLPQPDAEETQLGTMGLVVGGRWGIAFIHVLYGAPARPDLLGDQ